MVHSAFSLLAQYLLAPLADSQREAGALLMGCVSTVPPALLLDRTGGSSRRAEGHCTPRPISVPLLQRLALQTNHPSSEWEHCSDLKGADRRQQLRLKAACAMFSAPVRAAGEPLATAAVQPLQMALLTREGLQQLLAGASQRAQSLCWG